LRLSRTKLPEWHVPQGSSEDANDLCHVRPCKSIQDPATSFSGAFLTISALRPSKDTLEKIYLPCKNLRSDMSIYYRCWKKNFKI